jgi:hypothetical protein
MRILSKLVHYLYKHSLPARVATPQQAPLAATAQRAPLASAPQQASFHLHIEGDAGKPLL